MAKKKGFGVSPITNTIYYGTQDTEKHMWVGQKTDVTNDVIAAVYEWFMGNMEDSEGKKEEPVSTQPYLFTSPRKNSALFVPFSHIISAR